IKCLCFSRLRRCSNKISSINHFIDKRRFTYIRSPCYSYFFYISLRILFFLNRTCNQFCFLYFHFHPSPKHLSILHLCASQEHKLNLSLHFLEYHLYLFHFL